jgi:hypothetical protein
MAQVEIHIHHAYLPGKRFPNSATLEFGPNQIKLEVVNLLQAIVISKRPISCVLSASRADTTEIWLDMGDTVTTQLINANAPVPEYLKAHAPFLRKELTALLAKFWLPTSSIVVDNNHCTPSLRKRKQLLTNLNWEVLLGFCRLLDLPIKQLPIPLYKTCFVQSI